MTKQELQALADKLFPSSLGVDVVPYYADELLALFEAMKAAEKDKEQAS
jgi:hypothetical protein